MSKIVWNKATSNNIPQNTQWTVDISGSNMIAGDSR